MAAIRSHPLQSEPWPSPSSSAMLLLSLILGCSGPELTDTSRPPGPPPTPPPPPQFVFHVTPTTADTGSAEGEIVLLQRVVVTDEQFQTVTSATVLFAVTEGRVTDRDVVDSHGTAEADWRIPPTTDVANLLACAKLNYGPDCTPVPILKWNRPGGGGGTP